MGRVVVSAVIENLYDLYEVSQGRMTAAQVRRVEVDNAIVDTGATTLGIPSNLLAQLGLPPIRSRQARTVGGNVTVNMLGPVQLTIQGRDCRCDVMELNDELPVLIGQIPLESLDWVVDPVGQRLIGNPEHGGDQMVEIL